MNLIEILKTARHRTRRAHQTYQDFVLNRTRGENAFFKKREFTELLTVLIILGTIGVFASLFATTTTDREFPISYQGKLMNSSYVPVADGTYYVRFSIHDHATNTSCIWATGTSTPSTNCSANETFAVSVTRGLFSVVLGDGGTRNPKIKDDFNTAAKDYYLSIDVCSTSAHDTGCAGSGLQSPRVQLGAAVYAFNADELDGQDWDGITDQLSQTYSGTGPALTIAANNVTTLNAISVTAGGLTEGTALNISANALTLGKGINISSTSSVLTSADFIKADHTATYTSATTNSGNLLDLSRALTINATSTTLTVNDHVATFSDNCTQTNGTCTSSGDVVRINQQYTSNSGAALNVNTESTNSSAYALRVNDSGFADTTPFVIDINGNVGIGDSTPDGLLDFDFISTSTTGASQYGLNATSTDTGIVTEGTDTTYGMYSSVTRTGATGGTINTYGMYLTLTTDNAATGTSNAYGIYSTLDGLADTNYGIYSVVSAASGRTSYGLYVDAGTGAGTEYAAIFLNGGIGINTSSPSGFLHVAGDTFIMGDDIFDADGTSTTAVGYSGYSQPAEGAALVAVDSGDNICTDSLTSPSNIRFGDSDCSTTGQGTAILGNNTTGTTSVTSSWAFVDSDSDSAYDDTEDLFYDNAPTGKYNTGVMSLNNTSPTSNTSIKLEITDNEFARLWLVGTNATAANNVKVYLDARDDVGGASRGQLGTYSSHGFAFLTSDTVRMFIDSSGLVGIGTTSPGTSITDTKLDVVGGPTNAITVRTYGASPTPAYRSMSARGSEASPTATLQNDTLMLLAGHGYGTAITSAQSTIAFKASEAWSGTAQGTYITFSTTADTTTTLSERMRIDNAGKVAINTTSPNARLDVYETTINNRIFRLASESSSPFSDNDPVFDVYQGRSTTTSTSTVDMISFTMADDTVYHAEAIVVERNTGGTGCSGGGAGNGNVYRVYKAFQKKSGSVSAIAPATNQDVVSESGTDATDADAGLYVNGNTGFVLRVAGVATCNMSWHGTLFVSLVGS